VFNQSEPGLLREDLLLHMAYVHVYALQTALLQTALLQTALLQTSVWFDLHFPSRLAMSAPQGQ
jgi:hypothetical protein